MSHGCGWPSRRRSVHGHPGGRPDSQNNGACFSRRVGDSQGLFARQAARAMKPNNAAASIVGTASVNAPWCAALPSQNGVPDPKGHAVR